jgi:vWA-MoxR associated protein C-terminal domain/Effector-associated domain 2/vWA-MoxR associated protein middle region 0
LVGGFVPDRDEWWTRRGELRTDLEDQIVDLLCTAADFQSDSGRRQLVLRAERYAGYKIHVAENPIPRQWFYGLLAECERAPLGLGLLRKAVRALAPDSLTLAGIIHLIESWNAVDTAATALVAWPGPGAPSMRASMVDVWEELREHLALLPVTAVQVAFQLATDDRELAPPWHCFSAWHVFVHLIDRGRHPTRPDPYLVFLNRLVYSEILDRRASRLVEAWTRRIATDQGSAAGLDAVRRSQVTALEDRSPVHLVLEIDGAGAGSKRFHLCWRLERYRPRRVLGAGERREWLRRDELASAVSTVIRATERELASGTDDLALEFALPLDLLAVDVEWWRKEERLGPAKPLALDYSVTLRSLDRMNTPEWHRVWRERWRYVELPADLVTHWCVPAAAPADDGKDDEDMLGLEARLRANEQLVALVLSEPPTVGSRGMTELLAGLRSGIAVVVWARGVEGVTNAAEAPHTAHGLRAFVNKGRAADLPGGTRQLRLAAQHLTAAEQAAHPGGRIALLWDDPERLADVPPGGDGT